MLQMHRAMQIHTHQTMHSVSAEGAALRADRASLAARAWDRSKAGAISASAGWEEVEDEEERSLPIARLAELGLRCAAFLCARVLFVVSNVTRHMLSSTRRAYARARAHTHTHTHTPGNRARRHARPPTAWGAPARQTCIFISLFACLGRR